MPFQHSNTFLFENFLFLKAIRAGRRRPPQAHGFEKEKNGKAHNFFRFLLQIVLLYQ